jgi:hypothetical protein
VGAFAKTAKSYYRLRQNVCPSAWNNSPPNAWIFMEFGTLREFFEKSLEKIQVSLKSDKNNAAIFA